MVIHFVTLHCTDMHSKLFYDKTFCSNALEAASETVDRLEEFVGPEGPLRELARPSWVGIAEAGKGVDSVLSVYGIVSTAVSF